MGKLIERLAITPHITLLKWRRLIPFKMNYVSGYSVKSCKYLSCVQFRTVRLYPALEDHWKEHYIGTSFDERYYELPTDEEVRSTGPLI